MDHTKKDKELDKEELSACCKKLEEYKTLAPKEIKGILQTILEMNFTFEDLKNAKIGPILKPINSEKSTDPEYTNIKSLINQITEKAKQLKGADSAKPLAKAKESEKSEKTEKPVNFSSVSLEGLDSLPNLDQPTRKYILTTLSKEILLDYAKDPKGQEANRKYANRAAVQIEDYLYNKMNKTVEGKYSTEAMSLIAYIKDKTHIELRNELLSGSDVKNFVDKKESFISEAAKDRRSKAEKALLDANNADYHKKFVSDSLLYICRKCKSRKILKEEKQIRGGDEPMTSFFTCFECGAGWREG